MASTLSPEQRQLVRDTWAELLPDAQRAGELFYTRLFESAPHLRALFRGDMATQQQRLMDMLGTVVGCLDELDAVEPRLEALGRRHAEYGVEDAHYEAFREALVWTLQVLLGPDLTPRAEEAWTRLYDRLAAAMRRGAASAAPGDGPGA